MKPDLSAGLPTDQLCRASVCNLLISRLYVFEIARVRFALLWVSLVYYLFDRNAFKGIQLEIGLPYVISENHNIWVFQSKLPGTIMEITY